MQENNSNDLGKRTAEYLDESETSEDEHSSKNFKADHANMANSGFIPVRRLARSPVLASAALSPIRGVAPDPKTDAEIAPPLPQKMNSPTKSVLPVNSSYNVSTANKFEPLSNSNNIGASDLNNKVQMIQKNVVPPFVVVGATDFAKAIKIVCKHAKDNYTIKYMKIGTKVQVSEMTAYMAINNELKAEGIRYFTHDVDELKIKKFVISGLPCSDISDIENSLMMQKVQFMKVQEVFVKNARFDKECIYIVSFKANTTNLSELQKIKYVNRVSVRWSEHKNKNKGPTQCRNCYMYGHGMRNCHLPKKCIKCGSTNHSLDSCDIMEEAIKCANCNGNHMADSAACESRSKFIEMRTKFSTRSDNTDKKGKNDKKDKKDKNAKKSAKGFVSTNYDKDFPNKPMNGRTPTTNPWGPNNRNDDVASSSQTDKQRNKGASRTSNENADLFTMDEIIAITKDVFASLAQCKTKEDQLGVIVKLSAKYLYGKP